MKIPSSTVSPGLLITRGGNCTVLESVDFGGAVRHPQYLFPINFFCLLTDICSRLSLFSSPHPLLSPDSGTTQISYFVGQFLCGPLQLSSVPTDLDVSGDSLLPLSEKDVWCLPVSSTPDLPLRLLSFLRGDLPVLFPAMAFCGSSSSSYPAKLPANPLLLCCSCKLPSTAKFLKGMGHP